MVDLNVISTLAGAVIGAIVGSYGTYKASERSRKLAEQDQIVNLRRSLLAELGSMDELANVKSSNYSTVIPAHSAISAEVYKSNSSNISLLSSQEAEAVIRFYSGAIKLERTLETVRDLVTESNHPGKHDMTSINESIDILRDEWKTAVLELLSNVDDYPTKINAGERIREVDDSLSTTELWLVLNHERIRSNENDVEFQY